MSKSLFISKNAAELTELRTFTDSNEITLEAHSFLEFNPIPFSITESFNVLFFGSPRAVMFFKAQRELTESSHIACVGSKTKHLLESLGHKVDFSGEENRSISEVANDFKVWLGDRKVVFPVSTRSLGTISKNISSRQRIIVNCYETKVTAKMIPECDFYVFTSPSNVEGFFLSNTIAKDAKVISWGDSTANALKELDIACDHTLSEPTISAVIDYLS